MHKNLICSFLFWQLRRKLRALADLSLNHQRILVMSEPAAKKERPASTDVTGMYSKAL